MNSNFKPEELVKVQSKTYPVVGGRLRLAHEDNKNISIETSIIQYTPDIAVIQAKVTTEIGTFNGLGNATVTRDARLKQAILELAETRAIARALRFAGYGVEYTGFEEMPNEKETEELKVKTIDEKKAITLNDWAMQLESEGKIDIGKMLIYYKINSFEEMTIEQYNKAVQQLEKAEKKKGA